MKDPHPSTARIRDSAWGKTAFITLLAGATLTCTNKPAAPADTPNQAPTEQQVDSAMQAKLTGDENEIVALRVVHRTNEKGEDVTDSIPMTRKELAQVNPACLRRALARHGQDETDLPEDVQSYFPVAAKQANLSWEEAIDMQRQTAAEDEVQAVLAKKQYFPMVAKSINQTWQDVLCLEPDTTATQGRRH